MLVRHLPRIRITHLYPFLALLGVYLYVSFFITMSTPTEPAQRSITLKLMPFDIGAGPSIAIMVTLTRNDLNVLTLEYRWIDLGSVIEWPPTSKEPSRKDDLWKTTCFEAFFSVPSTKSYWEVNLSPSGDWNVYHFDDYRSGMKEEVKIDKVTMVKMENQRSYKATLHLDALDGGAPKMMLHNTPLDFSVAAVIQRNDDTQSFWAVEHTGDEPDFHRRDSFTVTI